MRSCINPIANMTLLAIFGIITLGLILLLVEVLIIPGSTIVGIFGLILMGMGLYLAFDTHGSKIGLYTLSGVIVMSATLTYLGFKSGSWKKFMLRNTVKGKVNVIDKSLVKEGDTGTTLTDLHPIGKASINGKKMDVQSQVGYIEKDQAIEVMQIITNRIIVNLKK